MDADEGGLFGNLPHSRPGTRSGKREPERPADSAERAARAAEGRDAPAARKPPSGGPARAKQRPPERPRDPLSGALDAAGRVAGTGWRVATVVPRELLRRLPRP